MDRDDGALHVVEEQTPAFGVLPEPQERPRRLEERRREVRIGRLFLEEFDVRLDVVPASLAKGLEFDRVWMFETTFNVSTVEGENLYYAAATRSKNQLFLVQIPRKDKKIPVSIAERWRLEAAREEYQE